MIEEKLMIKHKKNQKINRFKTIQSFKSNSDSDPKSVKNTIRININSKSESNSKSNSEPNSKPKVKKISSIVASIIIPIAGIIIGILQLLQNNHEPQLKESGFVQDGLQWSNRSQEKMKWDEAIAYCSHIDGNWRLPTISELRSLIRNCEETKTGGKCRVTDKCLSYRDCKKGEKFCSGCIASEEGIYSVKGDKVWLWSISEAQDFEDHTQAWRVDFEDASVGYNHKSVEYYVRCVR